MSYIAAMCLVFYFLSTRTYSFELKKKIKSSVRDTIETTRVNTLKR